MKLIGVFVLIGKEATHFLDQVSHKWNDSSNLRHIVIIKGAAMKIQGIFFSLKEGLLESAYFFEEMYLCLGD